MSAITLPIVARRLRGARAIVWLMLGLLVLQWAAQFCAAHCAVSDGARSTATSAASIASTTPADSVADSAGLSAAAHDGPCTLLAWCDLGQTPMLPSLTSSTLETPGPDAGAPPRSIPVSFLRLPEERPPAA